MKHKWTCYVKIVDNKLENKIRKNLSLFMNKVVMELHPTFRDPKRTIKVEKDKPVVLNSLSWGSFDINITIYWNKNTGKDPFTYTHELEFEEGGASNKVKFNFDRNKLKILGNSHKLIKK